MKLTPVIALGLGLVKVTDITEVVNPYDCSVDGDCDDEDLWEVNGQIVVYDRIYAGTDWGVYRSTSHQGLSSSGRAAPDAFHRTGECAVPSRWLRGGPGHRNPVTHVTSAGRRRY